MRTFFTVFLLILGFTLCAAELEFRPTFENCGVYFRSPSLGGFHTATIPVLYREKGTAQWLRAFDATFDRNYDSRYRASITGLKENTEYEVRIDRPPLPPATGTFRTQAEKVPIAREVILTAGDVKNGLVIRDKGTPGGYIRYTAAPGVVIDGASRGSALTLDRAEYVIVEGLTLRGGSANCVVLDNCRFVRVVNCDISRWGDPENWKFDHSSGRLRNAKGNRLWNKNGIFLNRGHGNVIERCHIHNPKLTSNAWAYGHPDGPQGIAPGKPESSVIRYNDIIGGDRHWWNDGIAGNHNFDLDGGLNRDTDVYGNFIAFANDDAIELDGGQQNVRCYGNHFENCFMGISIQGCMTGPSFIFNNRIVHLADEFGTNSRTFKTAPYFNGTYAASHFYNNTAYDAGKGLQMPPNLRIAAQNNIVSDISGLRNLSGWVHSHNLVERDSGRKNLTGKPAFTDPERGIFTLKSDSPARKAGVEIPGLNRKNPDIGAPGSLELPLRRFPLTLPAGRRAPFTVKNGKASAPQTIVARAVGGEVTFKVVREPDDDWFSVTPSGAALKDGEEIPFTVTVDPRKMTDRKRYRAVFLLRTAEGWSRPVSVSATTDKTYPEIPDHPEVKIFKLGAPFPSVGKYVRLEGDKSVKFNFDAPRDGTYTVMLRCHAPGPIGQHDSIYAEMNKEPEDPYIPLTQITAHDQLLTLKSFPLRKGPNTLYLKPREAIEADLLLISGSVLPFEKR